MSQTISTHPRIFSDRYLDKKMGHFSLLHLPEFEKKLGLIKEWQSGIASQRILKAKEEQLQDDFLKLFFGEVLGYSYRQDLSTWQLEREYKTVLDGTKADGALGYFSLEKGKLTGLCRAVIELKDARSDLDKPQSRQNDRRTPVQQAFDYASAVGGDCRWVIVSNFLEIRLYHQSDRSRYERFEISQLNDEATLKRFFFLLLNICGSVFGSPRISGSHHIFKTPWPGDPRINLQTVKGNAKSYQVRQVIHALKKYQSQEEDK